MRVHALLFKSIVIQVFSSPVGVLDVASRLDRFPGIWICQFVDRFELVWSRDECAGDHPLISHGSQFVSRPNEQCDLFIIVIGHFDLEYAGGASALHLFGDSCQTVSFG